MIPLDDIKDLLRQYGDIQNEIVMLINKMEELQSDKVSGSDSRFPFTKRNFNISGVPADKFEKYSKMLTKAAKMEAEVLDFIEKIPDSCTRQVFIYRYIDGMGWKDIANKLNRSETYVRYHIHDDFINNGGF